MPPVWNSFSTPQALLGGIQISKEGSFSPQEAYNSLLSLLQVGHQVDDRAGGGERDPQGKGPGSLYSWACMQRRVGRRERRWNPGS